MENAATERSNSYGMSQMCRILGISHTEVIRRVLKGAIPKPFLDNRGRRRWDSRSIDKISRQRSEGPSPTSLPHREKSNQGELFSRAITFLKAHTFGPTSAVDLAEELATDAPTTLALLRDWAELQGGLFLTAVQIQRINGLHLEGSWPIKTGERLVENLQECAASFEAYEKLESPKREKPASP